MTGEAPEPAPSERDAAAIVRDVLGGEAARIERFSTGHHHFVYDVTLAGGGKLVARLSWPSQAAVAQSAVYWSERLRPLGVPLPEVLAADTSMRTHAFPYVLMERLPGRDLGDVIAELSREEMRALASRLADCQARVATLPNGDGYGYSVSYEAPFTQTNWRGVFLSGIERSRLRIRGAKVFDEREADRVERAAERFGPYLAATAPTPFLHDITTKNVLMHEGQMTGIVDVDTLCFGDPLSLLGLIRMALIGHGLSEAYYEAWIEALNPSEEGRAAIDLYTAESCLDFMSELGQRFNREVPAPVDPARAARLKSLLDGLLAGLERA